MASDAQGNADAERTANYDVVPLRWVLVRDPAVTLVPKSFLSTDLAATPVEILSWFVRRWTVEVIFGEVRRHLGMEKHLFPEDDATLKSTALKSARYVDDYNEGSQPGSYSRLHNFIASLS